MLTLHQISKIYSDKRLFQPLSWQLPAGQAVWLKGANGVGKTTLLHGLAGFLSLEQGHVEYPDVKPVPQQVAIFSNKTRIPQQMMGHEALTWAASLLGADLADKNIERCIAQLGLKSLLDRPVSLYSMGQQQRLQWLLTLGLVKRPIWLLDEAWSHLDVNYRSVCMDHLKAHLSQGGYAVVAGHEAVYGECCTMSCELLPDGQEIDDGW